MGGSAGSNAELFSLMSQYGADDPNAGQQRMTAKELLQRQLHAQGAAGAGSSAGAPNIDNIWAAIDMSSDLGMPGYGGGGGSGGGGGAYVNPRPPVQVNGKPPNNKLDWRFPKYSQSWAFTTPKPTPYIYPKPFDPAIYGDPFSKKPNK